MQLMSCDFLERLRDRKDLELSTSMPHRPIIRRYAFVYYHVSLVYETEMPSQSFISIGQEKYSLRGTLSVVGPSSFTGPVASCRT